MPLYVPTVPLSWSVLAFTGADTPSSTDGSTATDIPNFTIPLGAAETWVYEMVVYYDAVTTGDIRFVWSVGATGATGVWSGIGAVNTASGASYAVNSAVAAGPTSSLNFAGFGAGTKSMVTLKGVLRGGGTAGNPKVTFRQQTADATASNVFTDSFINARRVS